MKHYKYLLIGGGMTSDAAARGIRELDEGGAIGLISAEPDPPYNRPNLSKGLWKGRPMEKVWRNTQDLGVEMILSRKVTEIDLRSKRVIDDQGMEYTCDKLLLATGGSPIHLPFGKDHIIYFRDLQDFLRLRALADGSRTFLVIGGSFIGSEIAAALRIVGNKVSMVFHGDGISSLVFPADLSNFLNDYYRQKGVELIPNNSVSSLEKKGKRFEVKTGSGRAFEVDGVVAGIGIRPNVDLAKSAGLKVENGIVVDEYLRTSAADIYAAGDVANFPHALLKKRIRIEHEDNALKMGKMAGRNMAGAAEKYEHAPMFYSDLFELGYEAVGELNSKMQVVADWQEPFKKGILYYLESGRVRGVVLWDVWKKVDEARALIAQPGPYTDQDLKGRISFV